MSIVFSSFYKEVHGIIWKEVITSAFLTSEPIGRSTMRTKLHRRGHHFYLIFQSLPSLLEREFLVVYSYYQSLFLPVDFSATDGRQCPTDRKSSGSIRWTCAVHVPVGQSHDALCDHWRPHGVVVPTTNVRLTLRPTGQWMTTTSVSLRPLAAPSP